METQKKKNDTFQMFGGSGMFPMAEYIKWRRLHNKAYGFHQLLPRSTLQTWLSQLFFKVSVFHVDVPIESTVSPFSHREVV